MKIRLSFISERFASLVRSRRGGASTRRAGKPLLAPEWLACADEKLNVRSYRLRLRWNGQRSLEPATLPPGTPCYLVLHPGLPFRRKLQRFPAQPKARQVLLRAAPDEFPLPSEAVSFCLGLRQEEGYVYALPVEIDRQLREQVPGTEIVLVGGTDKLDESACMAALEAYEQYGSALAFGGRRKPIARHWLLNLPLAIGAMLGIGLSIWLAAGADPFADILNQEQKRLQRETAVVAGQYAATESMLAAREQLARLHEGPDAHLPEKLAQLWQGVPAGHSIRRIEYKEGHLSISGNGLDVGPWLESAGFPTTQITTEATGKLLRFRAETDLAR